MMVSRRWWRATTLLLLSGALAPAAWGAGAPGPLPTPAQFEAAKPSELPGMRDQYLLAFNAIAGATSASDKDKFAGKVASDFSAPALGINSKRDDVRLNVAIMFHEMTTLAMEPPFTNMLKANDPALRYWGAKGLGNLAARLKGAHAEGASVRALKDAARKPETSGVVLQQILEALSKFGDVAALNDALETVATQAKAGMPDMATLQSIADGLNALSGIVGGANANDKIKSATVAGQLTSFTAQQLSKIEPPGGTTKAPADVSEATRKIAEAATRVANAAAGTSHPAPQGATAGELLMNINDLFGTPGGKVGKFQNNIKTLPVPPGI